MMNFVLTFPTLTLHVPDDMDLEESTIRRHQSSVSTLGHTSSFQSTDGARDLELVETGSSSRPVASALLSEGVKDKDVKSPVSIEVVTTTSAYNNVSMYVCLGYVRQTFFMRERERERERERVSGMNSLF